VPHFFYGMGEVEPLINLQLLHDDTHQIIKLAHMFQAMGKLIIDESTGLKEGDVSNNPDELLFVAQGTSDRIKWLMGPAPNAEFYTYLQHLQSAADLVSGRHDVTRGINPTGVTAGRAIQALNQSANIRIRSRIRDNMKPLGMAGRLLASRVQQFWPTLKTMRTVGPDKATDMAATPVQFRDFVLRKEDREANFDLRVKPGVNEEAVKQAEWDRMALLYTLMLVGPEALIEASGLSNTQKLLAELPILMLQRQAMQQGPPSPSSQMQQRQAA